MKQRLLPAFVLCFVYLLSPLLHAAAGDLDTSFGTGGIVITPGNNPREENGRGLLQMDGKLVVVSICCDGEFVLWRYNSNGTLDTTFDGDGKATSGTTNSSPESYAVIQQLDSKLVVLGGYSNNTMVLVRYNSDGSLDSSFDSDGKVVISNLQDTGGSVTQQADGKLVVLVATGILVRYHNNGALDTTFGINGYVTGYSATGSVIQQLDGKLMVGDAHGLTRYHSDGTLDTMFDGIAPEPLRTYLLIQQADGKFVTAGFNFVVGSHVLRYNSDGSLDTTFDGDGLLITNWTSTSLVQQSDGKLVVAGYDSVGSGQIAFSLARYNNDGSLDTSFDGDGRLFTYISDNPSLAFTVIQQPDGKLVVTGSDGFFNSEGFIKLARYESGQLDTDSDGIVDWLDTDNDSDSVPNVSDAFPLNPLEWLDTDNDTIGNNADWDDDGDGIPDGIDANPLSAFNAAEIVLPLDATSKGAKLNDTMQRQ